MKKTLITATLAAALFAGATSNILAQDNGAGAATAAIPIGRVVVCGLTVGQATVSVAGTDRKISDEEGSPSGEAAFESVAHTETGGTEFEAVSLTLSGSDEEYGSFTFTFDNSRPASRTTLEPNQEGADYPATVHVYANVTGTFPDLGEDVVFTNVDECHLVATDVQTFDPQQGETYIFLEDTEFHAEEFGYESVIIRAGSTVVMN